MTRTKEYSRNLHENYKMLCVQRSRDIAQRSCSYRRQRDRMANWRMKNSDRLKENRQRYKRTMKGWLTKIYSRMRQSSKARADPMPSFTKSELFKWLDCNYKEQFDILFHNWLESGCLKDLTPSINRLNDYKPYTFDNMELVTWGINDQKGRISPKTIEHNLETGERIKKTFSKNVVQKDMLGNVLRTYTSAREAGRQNKGFDNSAISKVCRGMNHMYKGYTWEYAW